MADTQVLIMINDRAKNSMTSINVKPRLLDGIVFTAV